MKWGRCSTYVQQKSKIKMAGVWWNQAKCFNTIIFSKDGWPRESYRHIILCIHMSYTVYTVCIDQPYRTPKRCPRSTFLLTAAPGVFCHVTWLRWSMATRPQCPQDFKVGRWDLAFCVTGDSQEFSDVSHWGVIPDPGLLWILPELQELG